MDQLDLSNLLLPDMQFFTKPTGNGLDKNAQMDNIPVAFATVLDQEIAPPTINPPAKEAIDVPQTFTSNFNSVAALIKASEEPISQPRLTTAITANETERVLDVNFLNDDLHVKHLWEKHKGHQVNHIPPTMEAINDVKKENFIIDNLVQIEKQPLHTPQLQQPGNNPTLDSSQNMAYNFTPLPITNPIINQKEVIQQILPENSLPIEYTKQSIANPLQNNNFVKQTSNIPQLATLQAANDPLPIMPTMTLVPEKIEKEAKLAALPPIESDNIDQIITLSSQEDILQETPMPPMTLAVTHNKVQQEQSTKTNIFKTPYFSVNPYARGDAIKNSLKPDELVSTGPVKLVLAGQLQNTAIEDFILPQSIIHAKQPVANDSSISYTPKTIDSFEPMVTEITKQSPPQQVKVEDLQILNLQVKPYSNMIVELKPHEIANFTNNMPQLQGAVIEQVVSKLNSYIGNNNMENIKVALHPADLGEVEISFDFSDKGRAKIEILAEKFMTYDLLVRNVKEIEEQLQMTKTDSNSLNFGLKNDAQGEGKNPQHGPAQFDKKIMLAADNETTLTVNLPINLGNNKLDILV